MGTPSDASTERGPFPEAWDQLRAWDPGWAESALRLRTNPWRSGVLPRKLIELICVALNAACTNLNGEGTRHAIGRALDAGATRDEIVCVLKCASVLSLHSAALSAPMLFDEAKAAGVAIPEAPSVATPACDGMKKAGQWNAAWDPLYALDPTWTDEMMSVGLGIYASGALAPKDVELLSIALDASVTHLYAPGIRRHINHALKAGATPKEIMEVLKLCMSLGFSACDAGVPILAEELATRSRAPDGSAATA